MIFLSVLISGHKVLVKTSSNDQHLLPFLAKYIIAIEPEFKDYITFVKANLKILTPSSPPEATIHRVILNIILRTNLDHSQKQEFGCHFNGNETKEQLIALGEDIFVILVWDAGMFRNYLFRKDIILMRFLKRFSNIRMLSITKNTPTTMITTRRFF